jgi:hypothetical protein
MNRLVKLQIIGPALLVGAIISAELAAVGLAHDPTSEALWYLNLRVLSVFQRSHYVLSNYTSIDGSQFFFVALPLAALCGAGALLKTKLPLAIASNLSFVYAAFLIFAWNIGRSSPLQASLTGISVPSGGGFYLIITLIASSLLSLAVSHAIFLMAAVRSKKVAA